MRSGFFPSAWLTLSVVMALMALAVFCADAGSYHFHPAAYSDAEWENGIARHARAGILVDKLPLTHGLRVGDELQLNASGSRHVTALPQGGGPRWTIWVDGPALDPVADGAAHAILQPVVSSFAGSVLGTLLVIFLLAALLMQWGAAVLARIISSRDWPRSLVLGTGYFIGLSVLLLAWRILAIAAGAKIGLALTVAGLLVSYGVMWRAWGLAGEFSVAWREHLPRIGLLSVALTVFALLYWVIPGNNSFYFENPHVPIGLFEAGRYANIASFIAVTDRIPILKQNYGQSLLGAIPSLIGWKTPHLAIMTWMAVSLSALLTLAFGLVRHLGGTSRLAWFVCGVLTVAGPRLTLQVVQLTDNHTTPLLYNAYADAVSGIGCFFIILILGIALTEPEKLWKRSTLFGVYILAALAASLCGLAGAHIIIVTLFTLGILGFRALRSHQKTWVMRLAALVAAVITGTVLSLPLGGTMTPERFLSPDLLPGLMITPGGTRLDLVSTSTYNWFINPYEWSFAPVSNLIAIFDISWKTGPEIYKNLAAIEFNLWDQLRSIFFPLTGLLLLGGAWRGLPPDRMQDHWRRFLTVGTIAAFSIGLFFAAFIRLNNMQWEVLRFMNAGYFGGMLVFGLAVGIPLLNGAPRRKRLLYTVMLLFACAGPAAGMVVQITSGYQRMNVVEKIRFIASLPEFTNHYTPERQDLCKVVGDKHVLRIVQCSP